MTTAMKVRQHLLTTFRRLCLATGVLAIAVSTVGTAHAQDSTETDPVFGLRPTDMDRHGSGFFTYYLEAGDELADEVTILNDGEVPVVVNLYLSAARTAVGGSASFLPEGSADETTAWIALAQDQVVLEPGERQVVPFTVRVPANAAPGDYIVGMVTQLESDDGGESQEGTTGSGQTFALGVVNRVAVAVLMTVEGERSPSLEVLDVALVDQGDQGARFFLTVHNTGNVMLKGRGTITVSDPQLGPLAEFSIQMDTVLAGDTAGYYVTGPLVLGDGEYELGGTGEIAAARGATAEDVDLFTAATIDFADIQFTVVDGGPPPDAPAPTVPPAEVVLEAIGSSVTVEEPASVLIFLVVGAGTLIVLIGGGLFLQKRGNRNTDKPEGENN
ncbi:MAG: hypothetical protein ISR43_02355 [Acidimicrobiia bacterium]|nr:hypothetical protein [Acidimicrobiia bacterium]